MYLWQLAAIPVAGAHARATQRRCHDGAAAGAASPPSHLSYLILPCVACPRQPINTAAGQFASPPMIQLCP